MTISADRCSALIRAYDAQGWHRTATQGDERASAWLRDELSAVTSSAHTETFSFERLDVYNCRLSIAGAVFTAVPLADSVVPVGSFAIHGRFADIPGAGSVAATRARHQGEDAGFDSLRQEEWSAVVAAVGDSAFGPALRNAPGFLGPSGPPAFQVPAAAWPAIAAAAAEHAAVHIEGVVDRAVTAATNVVARLGGRGQGRPLAVLTPKSGWWHCAGERGGGIATFLELARELAHAPLQRDVLFVATTGHELGFLGIRRYLETHPEAATAPVAWLHLGANIGGAATQTVIRSSDVALDGAVRTAIDASGTLVQPIVALTPRPPGGEAAVVAEFGGRFVSVVGKDFPYFHSTDDRWPIAIDAGAIAANARLMFELLRTLDRLEA